MAKTVEYTLTYRDKANKVHTKLFRGDIQDILRHATMTDLDNVQDAVDEVDYRKYRKSIWYGRTPEIEDKEQ